MCFFCPCVRVRVGVGTPCISFYAKHEEVLALLVIWCGLMFFPFKSSTRSHYTTCASLGSLS